MNGRSHFFQNKKDAYFHKVRSKCCKHLRSINNNFGYFTLLIIFSINKVNIIKQCKKGEEKDHNIKFKKNLRMYNAHSYHYFLAH